MTSNQNKEKKSSRSSKFYFKPDQLTAPVIVDVFKHRGWIQVAEDADNWDIYWCDVQQLRGLLDNSHRLQKNQYIPHFRNHYGLSTKNLLARNMKRYKVLLLREGKLAEAKLCDSVPLTFEIPNEYHMFVEEYRKHPGTTWIVKPAVGSNGRGIFLFKKHKSLLEWRNRKCKELEGTGEEMETWVVQSYIEDPYLIAGRKFDLRIYVLVTSFFPLKAWIARDGFARLSKLQFSLEEIENTAVHLTNTSIQLKQSDENEKQGCKWNFRKLRQFLSAKHGIKTVDDLIQQIGDVILTSLRSVQSSIMHNSQCFELYGYDILLQSDLTPWLLEVNSSPSMFATHNDDYKLKFNLISDVLNIIDLEGRRIGCETRVGGFDMFWNDGPVYAPCPGFSRYNSKDSKKKLNIFLGCRNDREEQLDYISNWKKYLEPKLRGYV